MKKSKKKKVEPLCKNCLLYNFEKRHCNVIVIHEGQKINPPTDPTDYCIFEEEYQAINDEGEQETFKAEIKEVRMWVEDPVTGKPAKNGIVKIEYPEDFFGDPTLIDRNDDE